MLTKTDLIEALQPIHSELKELNAGQKRLEGRLSNVETGQKRLETQVINIESMLAESIKDNAEFFNQTWIHIDQVKTLIEKRIKRIEDNLNFSH